MKRYLLILMVIIGLLVLITILLVGCAQEAGLENRIASLERKLTATESTILALNRRIEQLEKESLTESDILGALAGKEFMAMIYNSGPPYFGKAQTGIKIYYFYDVDSSKPIE